MRGFSLESVEGGVAEDLMGAFGDATGHDEPSVGGCEDCCGGNGEVDEEILCIGHPGFFQSAKALVAWDREAIYRGHSI